MTHKIFIIKKKILNDLHKFLIFSKKNFTKFKEGGMKHPWKIVLRNYFLKMWNDTRGGKTPSNTIILFKLNNLKIYIF